MSKVNQNDTLPFILPAGRQQQTMESEPKVVSLFCGCGGLDIGFKQQGFDLVYAADSDPLSIDVYSKNVDSRVFLRDVASEEFHKEILGLGSADVVLGGFPCQGFSKAGPKKFDDHRNALYKEMLRTVVALSPKLFIAENVDGLSQNFRGHYLEKIVSDFDEIGYNVDVKILDAAQFGVAQHRRRIFFVGSQRSSGVQFRWPAPTHNARSRNGEFSVPKPFGLWDHSQDQTLELQPVATIQSAIGDLLDINEPVRDHLVTGKWPKSAEMVMKAIGKGQKLCNVRHSETSVYTWQIPTVFGAVSARQVEILECIGKHRRHRKYGNIPNGNPIPVEEIERLTGLKRLDAEIEDLVSKNYLKPKNDGFDLKGAMFCSGLYKRPRWDQPSPTVLTNFDNPRYFLHPIEDRPFSLRECARLQGFSDNFVFESEESVERLRGGYRLVGNAVAPPLANMLAASVLRAFENATRRAA